MATQRVRSIAEHIVSNLKRQPGFKASKQTASSGAAAAIGLGRLPDAKMIDEAIAYLVEQERVKWIKRRRGNSLKLIGDDAKSACRRNQSTGPFDISYKSGVLSVSLEGKSIPVRKDPDGEYIEYEGIKIRVLAKDSDGILFEFPTGAIIEGTSGVGDFSTTVVSSLKILVPLSALIGLVYVFFA